MCLQKLLSALASWLDGSELQTRRTEGSALELVCVDSVRHKVLRSYGGGASVDLCSL